MATFLFFWSPSTTKLQHLPECIDTLKRIGINVGNWGCINNSLLKRGEKFFLACLNPPNNLRSIAIVASGWILSNEVLKIETTDPQNLWYVDVCWDVFLNPYDQATFYHPIIQNITNSYSLLSEQNSGLTINAAYTRDLELHWATFLAKNRITQHQNFSQVAALADQMLNDFYNNQDGQPEHSISIRPKLTTFSITTPSTVLPSPSTYASAHLTPGALYTRAQLTQLFSITDNTINNGVFRPKGYDSIWLFVTQDKAAHLPQLHDQLDGDLLFWDGQPEGRTDNLIVNHQTNGHELLLFYRDRKDQYPEYAFRYEGPFEYLDHTGSRPTHFTLIRYQPGQTLAELETIASEDITAAELEAETIGHFEGARATILTNKYERNPKNRAAAILIHGTSCQACGFSFEQFYGPHGKDFIQVHHKKPLASYSGPVIINPATDLAVLCSNCHSMIHRHPQNPLTVEELARLVAQAKSLQTKPQ